ncbi:sensor histidine kinase [Aquimarina sediminis]|uniref:sensor histidine kinase n=1 Tax=Aquimarina sediminis TaxID=2070536 RepID=UPI000CA06BB3|nr:histidine kinase [Aquimarina sediminis]
MKSNIKISLYWKIQILGWLTTSLYWGYVAFFDGNFIWKIGITDLLLDMFIGITLTHAYRNFALKKGWNELSLKKLIPRIVLVIVILSTSYMLLVIGKLYLVRLFILKNYDSSFLELFNTTRLQVFITGIRLMSIWVLAYHLYHYSRREIRTVQENAQLTIKVKEAQLNNLTAQLNPHFFFNSLNNIKSLISEKPNSARRAIDLLSDLLRNSLNNNIERLIPLCDEISLVKDYLELEKMRFEKRLQISVEIDEKVSKHLIPPLCIQSLVENAIKHGIGKRKKGGFIKVKVETLNNYIQISVQNSGILSANNTLGIGLNNLRERLLMEYNGKASFEILQMNKETVLATILIPVK